MNAEDWEKPEENRLRLALAEAQALITELTTALKEAIDGYATGVEFQRPLPVGRQEKELERLTGILARSAIQYGGRTVVDSAELAHLRRLMRNAVDWDMNGGKGYDARMAIDTRADMLVYLEGDSAVNRAADPAQPASLNRRLAVLLITPELLADMLKFYAGGHGKILYRVTKNALPDTAQVVTNPPTALFTQPNGEIAIVLQDPSFRELELGERLPYLPIPEISITFQS